MRLQFVDVSQQPVSLSRPDIIDIDYKIDRSSLLPGLRTTIRIQPLIRQGADSYPSGGGSGGEAQWGRAGLQVADVVLSDARPALIAPATTTATTSPTPLRHESCVDANSHRHARHDTDRIVQVSRLMWRCELSRLDRPTSAFSVGVCRAAQALPVRPPDALRRRTHCRAVGPT